MIALVCTTSLVEAELLWKESRMARWGLWFFTICSEKKIELGLFGLKRMSNHQAHLGYPGIFAELVSIVHIEISGLCCNSDDTVRWGVFKDSLFVFSLTTPRLGLAKHEIWCVWWHLPIHLLPKRYKKDGACARILDTLDIVLFKLSGWKIWHINYHLPLIYPSHSESRFKVAPWHSVVSSWDFSHILAPSGPPKICEHW